MSSPENCRDQHFFAAKEWSKSVVRQLWPADEYYGLDECLQHNPLVESKVLEPIKCTKKDCKNGPRIYWFTLASKSDPSSAPPPTVGGVPVVWDPLPASSKPQKAPTFTGMAGMPPDFYFSMAQPDVLGGLDTESPADGATDEEKKCDCSIEVLMATGCKCGGK